MSERYRLIPPHTAEGRPKGRTEVVCLLCQWSWFEDLEQFAIAQVERHLAKEHDAPESERWPDMASVRKSSR